MSRHRSRATPLVRTRGRGRASVRVATTFCEARRRVLPNGLRVLTVPAPGLHSAMIALYVRAGSRHETAARNGVSHFLEHLFFRGSVGYPDTVAMNAAVEAAGGSLNGITARDHGCYYTPIHPEEVGTGLSVLGDLIRRPLLHEMDVEREVILEEILDEVDASGRDIDPDNLSKRIVFGDHPLGFKIAGTPGIVFVTDPMLNPAGDTAVITAYPATSPQAEATETLVHAVLGWSNSATAHQIAEVMRASASPETLRASTLVKPRGAPSSANNGIFS